HRRAVTVRETHGAGTAVEHYLLAVRTAEGVTAVPGSVDAVVGRLFAAVQATEDDGLGRIRGGQKHQDVVAGSRRGDHPLARTCGCREHGSPRGLEIRIGR